MLVLTRRANQSIMIGHEIVVTVLEVRGDQVRLGIKAPRSIDVHREEIFAQLQQANRDAAQAPKQAIETLPDFAKPSDPDVAAEESGGRTRLVAKRRHGLDAERGGDRGVGDAASQRVHAARQDRIGGGRFDPADREIDRVRQRRRW